MSFVKVMYRCSLEEMHMNDSKCGGLVEETAAALNGGTVMLMLIAVDRKSVV